MKRFKKTLTLVLAFAMVATLFTAPASVSADPPAGETYEDYDVITYDDLLDTGNNHLTSSGVTLTAQNNLFHYDATSATHSAIYKFRYVAGATVYFQVFPGAYRSGDPFAYRLNNATTWEKRYSTGAGSVTVNTVAENDEIDIEVARLLVATGDNAGKYYTYLKANGSTLFEAYIDSSVPSGTDLNDSIQLNLNGSNSCTIKATPEAVEQEPADALYYYYDEIDYDDLLENGNALASETQLGSKTFTYNKTSLTGSAILRYRWRPGNASTQFQLSFDKAGSGIDYMFGAQLYVPGSENHTTSSIRLRPGYDDANAWAEIGTNIVAGQEYDVEFARLKVKNGNDAGKYYVYFKLDGQLIAESYVAANVVDSSGNYTSQPSGTSCSISNEIYLTFWGGGGTDRIMATPEPETYEDYDEVTYYDLNYYDGGAALPDSGIDLGSNYKLKYNVVSPTHSSVLKFRWTAGDDPQYSLYYDAWPSYPFGLAVKGPNSNKGGGATAGSNGAWDINPANSSLIAQMSSPIVPGNHYDMEFGRLKVKTGPNTGKYFVFLKVDGEDVLSYYFDGVSADGAYKSNSTDLTLTEIVRFVSGSAGNKISPIPEPETYEAYDEIYYSNLLVNGTPVATERSGSGTTYTYNKTSATSSAILKLRWKNANPATEAQISFDRRGNNDAINYMFGFQIYKASDEHPNGRVWLRPGYGPSVDFTESVQSGANYDIEFARLKVATGRNAGKYYTYFKMMVENNGVMEDFLFTDSYVAADVVDSAGNYTSNPSSTACALSNEIYITFWGGGGATITNPAFSETYADYDVVTYYDLLQNGSPVTASQLPMNGDPKFAYNRTSPTYSVVLQYRWIAGSDPHYVFYFDKWAGSAYPFCLAVKRPGYSDLGAAAGANGAWHLDPSVSSHIVQMSEPIVEGNYYDIEHGRLMVASGPNTGKFYVYVKVNGDLIYGYYYDGDNGDGTYGSGNQAYDPAYLRFTSAPSGNYITATPIPETYEDYDEIEYYDLKLNGEPVAAGGTDMSGATTFTYDRTSETGSAIFKFNWKTGDVPKVQLSFEKTSDSAMAYQFGAWLSEQGADAGFTNGRMWLIPGSGPQVDMPSVLSANTSYNVEFARLKVATGVPSNVGKYRVYIKFNDTLIAETYVAANVVDANGDYTSNPGSTACNVKSGEIFFAFWGSNGNAIGAVRELPVNTHTGLRGDLNNDAVITSADLTVLRSILLGTADSAAAADFNADSSIDVLDLIVMIKYLNPVSSYTRSGLPVLGMQEHLLEDSTKTAAYIADATATMGAGIYRLGTQLSTLFDPTSMNGVTVDSEGMAKLQGMVAALKAQGIEDILFVSDDFVHPSGYLGTKHPGVSDRKTVPDPQTEPADYQAWLEVNAAAYKALAETVPEIKYFEPYNEINLSTTGMERPGVAWNATPDSVHDPYRYSVQQKAGIMADLCWYVSNAVKSVDRANQVTTPSVATGTSSIVQSTFLGVFYSEIESGNYPTGKALADVRIDNFFTIVNVHAYPEYSSNASTRQTNVNAMATRLNNLHSVMQQSGDGGRRVWLTEVGVTDNKGTRPVANTGDLMSKALSKINSDLTYIDTVFIYKIADISASAGANDSETSYGLFYSGDASSNRYGVKTAAQVVYSFFNGGTTDYSALTALAARYAN